MILIVNKYLLAKGYKGISLWPFVVLRHKEAAGDKVFLNHERIHFIQQQELLVLPFYVFYLAEFFWRYIMYQNFYMAYRNISFEREAYSNEKNLKYCENRKIWAFSSYFSRKK
jgi:hypothetical protein